MPSFLGASAWSRAGYPAQSWEQHPGVLPPAVRSAQPFPSGVTDTANSDGSLRAGAQTF